MFDFSEMNGEQLEARLAELIAETSEETRDALDNDELEKRIDAIEEIREEIAKRQAAAEEEARMAEEIAVKTGAPIIEQEERKMDRNSVEYRDLWLRNLQGNLNEEEKRIDAIEEIREEIAKRPLKTQEKYTF